MRFTEEYLSFLGVPELIPWGVDVEGLKCLLPFALLTPDAAPARHQGIEGHHYEILLFPKVKARVVFNIPVYGFLDSVNIGSPLSTGPKIGEMEAFSIYRRYLEEVFRRPTDLQEDLEAPYAFWESNSIEIRLSVREYHGRYLVFSVTNREVKSRNSALLKDFYQVHETRFTRRALRDPNTEGFRIIKNVKLLIKAAQCHNLDNGPCRTFSYHEIEECWFRIFGRPKSILGECYEDLEFGFTGGSIKVIDKSGLIIADEKY